MKHPLFWLGLAVASAISVAPTLTNTVAVQAQSSIQVADKRLQDSRLSAAQLQQLNAVGMKIVVPTYVPAGFQAVDVVSRKDARFGPAYLIMYRKGNTCFGVEATSGGIGGLPPGDAGSYPIKNGAIGKSQLEQYRPGTVQGPLLVGQWASRGPFYRYVGANYNFDGGSSSALSGCQDLSIKEALLVGEGLRFVQNDNTLNQRPTRPGEKVSDTNSPTGGTIPYPSNKDLMEFKRSLKSGAFGNNTRISSAELNQRLSYQKNWMAVNATGAKFVGTWVAGDRTYYVYPSKVKSRLCVVSYKDGKYEFSNAQGIAREMRYQNSQFFWVDQADVLAGRDAGTGKLYPVFAAQGAPDAARMADFSFGFSSAECTQELPGG
jgi:hypothetical protein